MSDEDSCDEEYRPILVIDTGSGFMKAGFAGDDAPRAVFPTVLCGRTFTHMGRGRALGMGQVDGWIGDEALSRGGGAVSNYFRYPVSNGRVNNWDDMDKIWRHTMYNELRVYPEESSVLFTQSMDVPVSQKEKLIEIMFEEHQIPALYIQCPSVLAIYASGRTTGFSVDSGDGGTKMVAVYDGNVLKDTQSVSSLTGMQITECLRKALIENGALPKEYGGIQNERQALRDIKEKLAYVAMDAAKEEAKAFKYELPDGRHVSVQKERFECSEWLFHDKSGQHKGIAEMIFDSIGKLQCTEQVHEDEKESMESTNLSKEMWSNVLLSGGTTMLPGFGDRLRSDLSKLGAINVKVLTPPERKYSVWIGGSILTSQPKFQQLWVSKEKYDEYGASAVVACCF